MSQRPNADFPIPENTTSGTDLARLLERMEVARSSNDSGAARPPYLGVGGIWTDTSVTPPVIKIYDGTSDIPIGGGGIPEFDPTATLTVGAFVTRNGHIYRATAGHTGPWDDASFSQLTLPDGTAQGQLPRWNSTSERFEWSTNLYEVGGNFGVKNDAPTVAMEVGKSTDATSLLRVSAQNAEFQCRTTDSGGFMITQSASGAGQRWGWYWTATNDRWTLTTKSGLNQVLVQDDKMSINHASVIYTLLVGGQIASTAGSGIVNISDKKFKKNIKDLDAGLDVVLALQPRTFFFKKNTGHDFSDEEQIGFIAQEVSAAVSSHPAAKKALVHDNQDEGLWLNEQRMIPILVNALKEAAGQITELKLRVESLENA